VTLLADTTTLTTAEIDAITTATIDNNREAGVQPLERTATPSLNYFNKIKRMAAPVQGGYKVNVKGNRNKSRQSWSGRDRLRYQSSDTLATLQFGAGRAHDGEEMVHDQLELAGVAVDYSQAARGQARPWGQLPRAGRMAVTNLAKEKLDDLRYNWLIEEAKDLWRANSSDAKMWSGLDALFPASTTMSGTIGGKSRSIEALQHNVSLSVAAASLELEIEKMIRNCTKRNGGQASDMVVFAGFDFIDDLKGQFRGSFTRFHDLPDMVKRYAIGIPDDAFILPNGTLIIAEPMFELLQEEELATVSWLKRAYFFQGRFLRYWTTPGQDGTEVVKPTPYDRQITYLSKYAQRAIGTNKPNAQGVMAID